MIALAVLFCIQSCSTPIEITDTRCENQQNPSGIETSSPLFSWKIVSGERNIYQTAYQIKVADSKQNLADDKELIWDSGKIISGESINIPCAHVSLQAATRYYWKVKIWDNRNNESEWSAINTFRMGLLTPQDWHPAQWIALEEIDPKDRIVAGYQLAGNTVIPLEKEPRMPQFRKSFTVDKKVNSATLFISGLGHFELSMNGSKVGENFLDAGWTNYDKTALYVTFDVTGKLNNGENVIGVRLGNGFLHIPRDSTRYRKLLTTFAYPKMIGKLIIEYTDGTKKEIVSDTGWRVTTSPITFSSMYGGEDYDATLEQKDWNRPCFDDRNWQQPVTASKQIQLAPQIAPPLRVKERFDVQEIIETQPGIYIYDFGQNASGIISLKATGPKGSRITMRPGEYLTHDGFSNQNNSGYPFWYAYTLAGEETESWQPAFTYYGCRYVQVEGAVPAGYPNPYKQPVIEELQLLHTRNNSEAVGTFSCSNPLFNDIYSLIDWSVRSNLASVLTDCPHREKLGWLEVTHLMSSSIAYCYDIKQMYTQMIGNMKNSQLPNGLIPSTSPEYAAFPGDFQDSPEWGSAGVILPWFLYEWYGDVSVLADSYELMKKYTGYLTSRTQDHILYHGLGDWYDLGPHHPGYNQLTSRGLTPTAIYYQDLHIMAQTAQLLGYHEDAIYYRDLAEKVKQAFNSKFFNKEKGYYDTGSQTANAMPLYLGLAENTYKESILQQIIQDVRLQGNSITAGDIGLNYLLRVLESENASEVIFDMNNQTEKPGYGYQLKQGATSLTESWNALQTASHNHCMLGHLMDWFYSGLGGIKPDKKSNRFPAFHPPSTTRWRHHMGKRKLQFSLRTHRK